MRKLIYFAMISLDGYIARSNGSQDWVVIDEELHTFVNEQQQALGAYLYGRRMYELMADAWPPLEDDPASPDYVVAFSRIWKAMPKVVFSQTLDHVAWNARLVKADPAVEVAGWKAQPGNDLEVGGAALASTLLRHHLVDEYQLFVNPVVLGSGLTPFASVDRPIDLRLQESRTFASGVVFLRYQREKAG